MIDEVESGTIFVEATETQMRLDKLLAIRFPKYSRTYFQHLIKTGLVVVNGTISKKSILLKEGAEIEIEFALTPEISLEAEEIALDILYEDDDLLAINKPVGMVVHPALGNWSHTFVNALLFYCKQLPLNNTLRPGIVHRLDKDTSGVLLAAKNELAQKELVYAFSHRLIKKEYLAICLGHPKEQKIEGNIGRHPMHRKKMTILQEGGKEALTLCQPLSYNAHISLIRLFPQTGRTHQLRVHLKSIGHPILGDALYGNAQINEKWKATRQLLHAHTLTFLHPIHKRPLEIKAPLPEDMLSFIQKMNSQGSPCAY